MSTSTRDSSVETSDPKSEKYPFGYNSELSNQDTAISTAKRLRQRLQRQQSGQTGGWPSGRRFTGDSSGSQSLVGTPTDSGRCFTFSAAQRVLRNEDRKPSVNQGLSEMILDAIHLDDANLVEKLLITHSSKPMSTSPSIGSTNTFTDLAQRRHGNHRRSNASSTISTSCAMSNILHVAVAHKQKDIVELLLKTGYDPNALVVCHCKGNCTASGNIPLSSILPKNAHSNSPELCSTCSALRVVSIIDQSPLAIAVRVQSPAIIEKLILYSADVNQKDEDGNTPLMLAVRESPINWPVLHVLIIFGAEITQKNSRGICALDLAPELRKLQESCVESLFQTATTLPDSSSGDGHERESKFAGTTMRNPRRLHVDCEKVSVNSSFADRGSLSKAPLSPRPSAAPSVSTCSMLDTMSAKENRRKSFVSIQLRRNKTSKESSLIEQLNWEQAWEMLKKMACNYECIPILQICLIKFIAQKEVGTNLVEADLVDSYLGGLMHQMILTMLNNYLKSTPSYQRTNRRQLIGNLAQLVNFCFTLLQRSGSTRQFSALATINKIIDTALVHGLFVLSEIIFHSSRLLNRSHDFHSHSYDFDAAPSPTLQSMWSTEERRSTSEKIFSESIRGSIFKKRRPSEIPIIRMKSTDLTTVFNTLQPSIVIACLHNAITMQNREAGSRSICSPANRWRQCSYHCLQLLVARLLLFLTSYKDFRYKLCERQQLKSLIQLLEPTLEPQLLCLLLQILAILAVDPNTHPLFVEFQIDDILIQLLLPADDFYYTNQSTKFGIFVKHHAARILVYLGMGDRVGSRVNLFQAIDLATEKRPGTASGLKDGSSNNEDDFIFETCQTVYSHHEFSKTAMSVEGVLQKILGELAKQAPYPNTSDPITEESGTLSPPLPETIIPPVPAVIEEKPEEPKLTKKKSIREKTNVLKVPSNASIRSENAEKKEKIVIPKEPSIPAVLVASQPNGNSQQQIPTITKTNASSSATSSPSASLCQPTTTVIVPSTNCINSSGPFGPMGIISMPSIICVANLEVFLQKMSLVVDSTLLLRLLLHKLRWDLGLVVKRRSAVNDRTEKKENAERSFVKSKSFDRREDSSVKSDKRYLRVDQGSRLSKRVHIRRSSSVEILRPKRFSSGAKELRMKERRKRLGTDTSSGSGKSKKTTSSNSSVHKHLPRYIAQIFRGRMGTDPGQTGRKISSSSSNSSEAVLEFTRKLQNFPQSRRDMMRQAYRSSGQQDSSNSNSESRAKALGYTYLPEVEVNGASPPRSIHGSIEGRDSGASLLSATARRPSSPQAIPGLPLIEIRRPSAMSQFEFGYFVNSPEICGTNPDVVSDCAPLLLSGEKGSNLSRKSSDGESSICGWSSRASSACSQRSSSGAIRLSTGTSIASGDSGPFLFSFVLRKRASTIGTRIPLPKRGISRSSGDSLRVPDRESPLHLLTITEMSPDFQCIRQLLLNLIMNTKHHPAFVQTMNACVDLFRQVLQSPQHPTVKNWCSEIVSVVSAQLDQEDEIESDDKVNDEYLELQDQIIGGSLPCPREDVALLAAIQLCVEENWPGNKRTQTIRRHLLKGQFGRIRDLAQKIMVTPWEVDQNLYCTPPRVFNETVTRKQSIGLENRRRSIGILRCISDQDAIMSDELQNSCLPVDLRGDKRTIKLVKERKRKLFHSRVYENEIGMKKLYIQTAKKLPAYGCKVFQVKELLHGRTLRKTVRLLCLSSSTICLLEGSSKTVLRKQHALTLQQWRVGGGLGKHQLLLEFRGHKWQLIAPSYNTLKSISMTLWEIMQSTSNSVIQKSFNCTIDHRLSIGTTGGHSSRTASYSSNNSFFIPNLGDENVTLFKLELERLQYVLQFTEEVAFQLSLTEYQLFYAIQPLDFVRFVGCDLANIGKNNPSAVKNLIKRLSEVSSWITHIIISRPTHDERKSALSNVLRIMDTCWNIGNFNGAVEILMGLRSDKLRPFWLSLKQEERQRYEELNEIMSPNGPNGPSSAYLEAVQRALRMPQCRLIPFFGTFLGDLYKIVNEIPNVVVIGHEGETEKLKYQHDLNGDDHFSSDIGVGGLLNTDKTNLVSIVIENLEVFHKHSRDMQRYLDCLNNPDGLDDEQLEPRSYEPVQPIATHGVTLIPLDTRSFDLDILQRIQHGCTVIRYDIDSGRSQLCRLILDCSCSTVSWRKIQDGKECQNMTGPSMNIQNLQLSDGMKAQNGYAAMRPVGAAVTTLDEGFIRTSYIKAVEIVDPYDVIDLEGVYRRHSVEEMSVPVLCWAITFGCMLADNEILYFLAPQQVAQCWMQGLQTVVKNINEQQKKADRRVLWLKKLYLQLYGECEHYQSDYKRVGPKPVDALQAFGGKVERWRTALGTNPNISNSSKPTDSSSSNEGGGAKSRLKQMTIQITRRVKGASRDCSRSQSPQPQSPLVRPPSIKSQLSSQSGPPVSPGYLLKPRGDTTLSDAGDEISLYTPRSRTPTSSSYGGRSVKSWRSRGGETPNSGSISSSGAVSGLGFSAKEYQEKAMSFPEFVELFRLFNTRMRKDLKDLFNESVVYPSANSHGKTREKQSPRLQSRMESISCPISSDFIPNDVLTRNTASHQFHLNEKQLKIYNYLAIASITSTMDTSRNSFFLTPASLKQFIYTQQMESCDETYALKLIQEHEPDPLFRNKQLMSFEGFVRYLSDPSNFAFIPELVEPNENDLHYPLSYYYICSSHNTYLTGHQLKGESSAEMYRQVLLNGCRCIELDVHDGEEGLPLIFHGHTFTSKINFRPVVDIIKKSAFITSNLPVILSIENHCSLQQQAKMAQMFKTAFGDRLVSNFLFEQDFSDNPTLPSPFQLQGKILIKNKKLISEPSAGLSVERTRSEGNFMRKQSRGSYDSSLDAENELELFDDDEGESDDDESLKDRRESKDSMTTYQSLEPSRKNSTKRLKKPIENTPSDFKADDDVSRMWNAARQRPLGGRLPNGHQIAQELSDLVIYSQAVKFKGFVMNVEKSEEIVSEAMQKIKGNFAHLTTSGLPPRRQKSSSQISTTDSMKSEDISSQMVTGRNNPNTYASCYQVTSITENSARKLCRKHPFRCINYTKDHIMRTYPGGMRIDSSNFNPVQFWQFGLQMVALNYQTPDVAMAVNAAMFEQSGNCGYTLKPRAMWDPSNPLYSKLNPLGKDIVQTTALVLQLTVISGQYVCPGQFTSSPQLEVEIIGIPVDCFKEKTKVVNRNSVNPIWNYFASFRITFVDLAFLRISVYDTGNNNRIVSQRVVPVKCLRQGYRHLPLRSPANQPLEYSSLFLRIRFEQEEHIYLHEEDASKFPNYEPEMPYQWLKTDPDAPIKRLNFVKKQIFVLRIQGLTNDDVPVIVYAESCSTVRDVIQKALMSAGRSESPDEYYLFEEGIMTPLEATAMGIVGAGGTDLTTTQRMLPAQEPIMDAVVCCWNGTTRRFVLRKKSSDPSGRAWITSIIKPGPGTSSSTTASSGASFRRAGDWMDQVMPRSGAVSPSGFVAISHHGTRSFDTEAIESTNSMDYLEPGGLPQRAKSMGETFLICIHNVSDNHPYAILRTSINNTATDIIKQIMMKTQRFDVDENDYVLVEELRDNAGEFCRPVGGKLSESTKRAAYRILDSDENVWKAQTRWNCAGRFLLEKKSDVESQKGILKSEHTRKISLSNMRQSMNIPRRISRFGKSLTLDSGKSGNVKDAN